MQSRCDVCKFRAYAERNPNSFVAWLWRWHTRWCPGWKAYLAELERSQPIPGETRQEK